MNIIEHMTKNEKFRNSLGWEIKELVPRVVCADGFNMSVQASEYAYCSPRENRGPHYEFEVGFPSEREPLLMEWAEQAEDPTGTVYGYVPANVIDEVIKKHGGFAKAIE